MIGGWDGLPHPAKERNTIWPLQPKLLWCAPGSIVPNRRHKALIPIITMAGVKAKSGVAGTVRVRKTASHKTYYDLVTKVPYFATCFVGEAAFGLTTGRFPPGFWPVIAGR
jgi:hypothetical protein